MYFAATVEGLAGCVVTCQARHGRKYTYLVVIGEGDDAGANPQEHAWMDLAMCVHVRGRIHLRLHPLVQIVVSSLFRYLVSGLLKPVILQILRGHADHGRLLFLGIEVFDAPRLADPIPAKI